MIVLPQKTFITPGDIALGVVGMFLAEPAWRAETWRYPTWLTERLLGAMERGMKYEDVLVQEAWRRSREICLKLADSEWDLPVGLAPGEVTMSASWPEHPFVDLARGLIYPQAMLDGATDEYAQKCRRLAECFRGQRVLAKRSAVKKLLEDGGFDWGQSVQGNPVSVPPIRRKGSANYRLQKLLWGHSDVELQTFTGKTAMELAEKHEVKIRSSNCDTLLTDVKKARGIERNLRKGATKN